MKAQQGFTTTELAMLLLGAVCLGGWIANIVKLVGMNLDHVSGLLVARAAGIIVAPLGMVLGFL